MKYILGLLLVLSVNLNAFHCIREDENVRYNATVWCEDGYFFLSFSTNILIIDKWHYVPSDYLDKDLDDCFLLDDCEPL